MSFKLPEYGEPTFTFWGQVSDETQSRLRERARGVMEHFYRTYGTILSDLDVHYAADYDSGEDAIEQVTGRRTRFEGCGQILDPTTLYINAVCSFVNDSIDWGTFDHEYFHNLQIARLAEGSSEAQRYPHRPATWFNEGGAAYAASEYKWSHDHSTYAQQRNHWIGTANQAATPLDELENPGPTPWPTNLYGMGYLAVELLIEQAGIDVLLDINRLMPIKGNWDAAFQEAVGMTTHEFYTLFAEWLPEQRAHTQSSRSSRPSSGFNFLGEVTAERQQEIRDRYAAIQTHFADYYDIERMGATINIAATLEDLTSLFEDEGLELPTHAPCFWGMQAGFVLVDRCEDPLPLERVYMYAHLLQRSPHPSAVIEDGHQRAGPIWLYHGTERYGETDYRGATDASAFNDARATNRRSARGLPHLPQLETRERYYANPDSNALAWLAIDWLVQHAGPESYIKYLVLRPRHPTWQATFEAAFNLTVEAFYEQFAAYQRRGFR